MLSQNKLSEKLEQAFGSERIKFLKANSPDSIEYYSFLLENGFRISEKKYLNQEQLPNATPIEVPKDFFLNGQINIDKFNIFLLPVNFRETENSYYSISGTDYIIILRSKEYLNKKFQSKSK
jgi:hypothetical protein